LIAAIGNLGAAAAFMALRLEKPSGDALRQALQVMPPISGADAVEDPRLKALAGQIDVQRQYLDEIAKRFH
jgi:hypothetical protein